MSQERRRKLNASKTKNTAKTVRGKSNETVYGSGFHSNSKRDVVDELLKRYAKR